MSTNTLKRSALGAALLVAVAGGYGLGQQGAATARAAVAAPLAVAAAPAANQVDANAQRPGAQPDFRSIVDRYGPAVVNISVEGTRRAADESPLAEIDPDSPFGPFLRRFGPQFGAPQGEQIRRGMGSGFIVSADGVVLTNAHVVADASTVTVRLNDRREFIARLVGIDRLSDVAVLRIDAHDLPTVPLGDPAQTRAGDWVLAIGAPFGFENSVTAGIVSAKSRSLPDEGYVPFIQTDVAINPGNSGGPLFNLNGEVIGINSQIYSRSGGYQGLSFAIPIDVAVQVKDQLLAHGKVTRGRLGVTVQNVNQALADSFGLGKPRGALVSQVDPQGPAAKAGLQAGDVILGLGGVEVDSSATLPQQVAALPPGSTVALALWRDGKSKTIELVVGEQAGPALAAADPAGPDAGRLGLAVRALSADEREQADAATGLLVTKAGGAAARAGIREGDIILSLNGRPVSSAEVLRKQVNDAGKHVALLIQRDQARIFVPVELG